MNDKMMARFSAYLDGLGTVQERQQIEKIIAEDQAARQVFEEMRTWTKTLDMSKPQAVQAPPELRQGIMARLRKIGPGGPDAPAGGPGGWLGNQLGIYLVAGAVMVGMTGLLMYYDHQKQVSSAVEINAASHQLKDGQTQSKHRQPQYRGEFEADTRQGVSPDAVQSFSDHRQAISGGAYQGDVYVSGSGRNLKTGGFGVSSGAGRELDMVDVSAKVRQTLGLELSDVWGKNKIESVLQENNLSDRYVPDEIVLLAQKNNLHPGLFIAALTNADASTPEVIAAQIRHSLNQTVGQKEEARLLAVMEKLDADKMLFKKWQAIMQQ
ncbi:hypothetical protein K8S19_04025 [bacterium]|nr:hypothetical protein [bacterium]